MTRQEAEKEAKLLNAKEPQWFCPLINGDCNKRCVNFIPAFVSNENEKSNHMIHDAKEDSFIVEGFVCSNLMFIGNSLTCG